MDRSRQLIALLDLVLQLQLKLAQWRLDAERFEDTNRLGKASTTLASSPDSVPRDRILSQPDY